MRWPRAIAKGAYGDASLWYLIAEANGLGSNLNLRAGQILSIPTRVQSANNAETFKPYDPSKVVGDSPIMMAMSGDKGGCGGLGQVIVAVVAIVVTIYTAGPVIDARCQYRARPKPCCTEFQWW